jgi:adenylate cyclase
VRAAQEMIELIGMFNVERSAAGKPEIRISIGIASGTVVAGYAGTNERATYTCIGDTVNLAARLEVHTRVAQREILVDAATRQALGDSFAVEPLGLVPFKGKAAAVEVFSVAPGKQG